jgi:plasmid stabilization system protein ParE
LKPVRFTARAERDMSSIVGYYENIAPDLSIRIVADIRDRIEGLRHFPKSGQRIGMADIHRVLSRRHRFKIAYRLTGEAIEIVGVFRFQDRDV